MSATGSGTFRYVNPPTIHWGPGCIGRLLERELQRLGARRAFLVTTRSVANNPALLEPLQRAFGDRLVGTFSAIRQHAPAKDVAAAVEEVRAANADLLVSLGGGSPIDAAKAIAFSLATGLDVDAPDAMARSRTLRLSAGEALPHLAIPTTLSAAEMSAMAGYTASETKEKIGFNAPALLPAAVFYDAQLTLQTPRDLWLATGIRAVDHAVEGFLAEGEHPFSDALALDALRRLRAGLLASHADPHDLAARTECQLGAWFSMTLPVASATGLSHVLGKRIGSRHDIGHGVSSCLVLPHAMRFAAQRQASRLARLAEPLGVDTRGLSDEQAAARAADAVADLVKQLGLPQHLADFGLSEPELEEAVDPLVTPALPRDALLGILRAAR